ncbi:MAG: hypothetical protein ABIA63_08195 [bacterium]
MSNRKLYVLIVILVSLCCFYFFSCTVPHNNPYDRNNPDFLTLNGPFNIKAEQIGSKTVRLSWNEQNNHAQGIVILKRYDYEPVFKCLDSLPCGKQSTIDFDVSLLDSVIYTGYAYDAENSAAYGDTMALRIMPDFIEAPESLAVYMPQGSKGIRLVWKDKSAWEQGFLLERKSSSQTDFVRYIILGPDFITYLDTGITSSAAYYYRLASFYDTVRSSYSDIVSLEVGSISAPLADSSTFALYHFDKGTSDTAFDSGPYSSHMLLFGGAKNSHGRFGGSLFFNGNDSAVADFDSGVNYFEIEFWFKAGFDMDSNSSAQGILGGNDGILNLFYVAGSLYFIYPVNDAGISCLSIKCDFYANSWDLIRFSYTSSQRELLINGAASQIDSAVIDVENSLNSLKLGVAKVLSDQKALHGHIDELRINKK